MKSFWKFLTLKQKLKVWFLVGYFLVLVFPVPLVLAILGLVLKDDKGDAIIPIYVDIIFWILPFVAIVILFMLLKHFLLDKNKKMIESMMGGKNGDNLEELFRQLNIDLPNIKHSNPFPKQDTSTTSSDEINKDEAIEVERVTEDDKNN